MVQHFHHFPGASACVFCILDRELRILRIRQHLLHSRKHAKVGHYPRCKLVVSSNTGRDEDVIHISNLQFNLVYYMYSRIFKIKCLVLPLDRQSSSLGHQILVDRNILATLLAISRLLHASKWRLGG